MLLGLNRAIFIIVKNRFMKVLYNVLIILDCYNKAGNIHDKQEIVKKTQLISNILFPMIKEERTIGN